MARRSGPGSPAALLARALARDAARPFVTYYDLPTGGRVELSVATFDNWTAKTAGLLADLLDDLDVAADDSAVSLTVPAHWASLVWAQAVWTVGARLVLEATPDAAVSVRDTEQARHGDVGDGRLVVVSTAPLGGPVGAGTPSGAVDYGGEVLAFPDVFTGVVADVPRDSADDLAARLVAAAPAQAPSRRLVVARWLDEPTLAAALVEPLVLDGSVVLVHTDERPDPGRLAAIAADERAFLGSG